MLSASANFFLQSAAKHFCRLLTCQNRGARAAVLGSQDDRVHGSEADYAHAITSDLVLGITPGAPPGQGRHAYFVDR